MPNTISKELTEKMETLKKMVSQHGDFQEIFDYFHDVLIPDDNFLDLGEAAEDSPILQASLIAGIENIAKSINLKRTIISNEPLNMLSYIKEFRFYHGPIMTSGAVGDYFFFEEEGIGILGIQFPENPQVWYARFTAIQGDGDSMPQYLPTNPDIIN